MYLEKEKSLRSNLSRSINFDIRYARSMSFQLPITLSSDQLVHKMYFLSFVTKAIERINLLIMGVSGRLRKLKHYIL